MRATKRPAIIDGDIAYIPLGKNAHAGYAVVDAQDAGISDMYWHKHSTGYPMARDKSIGMPTTMHRLLVGGHGRKLVVDHIDGDKLNNRRSNLRLVPARVNCLNHTKLSKRNTSGYWGVSWAKDTSKWVVHIRQNSKSTYLGCFTDIVEAAKAYDRASLLYHGEHAKLNFK